MAMVNIAIEHIGVPSSIGDVNAIRQIDGTESPTEICEIITKSVGESLKNTLLLYEPIIKITYTDEKDYLLDADFIRIKQPFSTHGDNSNNKKLKVFWIPVKNTNPTQSSEDASTQTDNEMIDTHQYIQTQTTDQNDDSSENFIAKLLESMKDSQSQSPLAKNEKSEFDQYINETQEFTTNQTEISNDYSADVLLKVFNVYSSCASFNEGNHSSSISSSNEQVSNPENHDGNVSTPNQSRLTSKRPNQSKNDTKAKRQKKSSYVPKEIICVSMSIDEKIEVVTKSYDPSQVLVISNFEWNKMIHFKHDVDSNIRMRYLSESKIPCIQQMKLGNVKSKNRILPVLELPPDYHSKIMNGDFVIMVIACVKECQKSTVNGVAEIELCFVGYKKFIYYSNENEEMLPMSVINPGIQNESQEEQLIFKIKKPNNEKNEYKLMAHSFRVKNLIHDEIGPVMFRLSAEYIEAARTNEYSFGENGAAHRYAAYLLKHDKQLNQYVPDLESLGFSRYIFQD